METWFILTGNIDSNVIHQTSYWFLQQSYAGIKKIKFYISSTGGDMDSAFRLYDFLRTLPLEIETIGFGQVDSAAIILFLTGTKRTATKGCRFLLHSGTFNIGLPNGPLQSHEEALKIFKELKSKNISIIAKETKNKLEDVNEIVDKSTIFNSEEAKKFGLVDKIIDQFSIPTPLQSNSPTPVKAI